MSEENETPEDDIQLDLDLDEVVPAPDQPEIIPAKDGIEELRAQLDAERAARREAERRATEAQHREHAARIDKEDTDIQLVSNAIDTLDRDTDLLKQSLQYAMQTGDHARAVEIQQELGDNSAKLLQLRNGLEAMKSKPKAPPPPVHSDPVEAFASRLSPRSADWVRSHPEFVRDPAKNRKMIAAHELAVADGIPPDTDEYFSAIEETLRVRPQRQAPAQEEDAMDYSAKVTQRRDAAPAAAPVSRGTSSRPNVVRLTAAEREMAEMMNMKPEDYAKNKMALQKEGKLK
jgi:hypothetical protein